MGKACPYMRGGSTAIRSKSPQGRRELSVSDQRRGLDGLDLAESTVWARIEDWAQQGSNRILPIAASDGQEQLLRLQMTTLSTPGAVTLNCGGILADHGWLK